MESFSGVFEQYFREVEPSVRKQLYAALREDASLPPLVGRLYELRYVNPKDPGAEVDLFLWHLVNLLQYHNAPSLFKKKTRKDILGVFRALGLEAGQTRTPEEEQVLYWEFRNAARRYYGTVSSAGYGRKLFGILAGKEDEKLFRMREDARKLSFGNAEKYDLEAETALFCRAVNDEFMAFFQTERGLNAAE